MKRPRGYHTPALRRRLLGRRRYLFRFWQVLLEHEALPQCDRWIARQMKSNRQFGRQDRFWYSEMLFAGLRFGYLAAFLEHLLEKLSPDEPLRDEALLQALEDFKHLCPDWPSLKRCWQAMGPETFFFWIHCRYQCVPEQVVLETGLDEVPAATARRAALFAAVEKQLPGLQFPRGCMVWHAVPLWYEHCLAERAACSRWDQARTEMFLGRQSYRPPLWLRLNDLAHREQVMAELIENEFSVDTQGLALKVSGHRGIFELNSYRRGWIEIQDLASQHLGNLIRARPGQMIWDCCAGGGGKTLQVATHPGGLRRTGAVYASDIREYKLKELLLRARRAQLPNVRVLPWDGTALPDFGKEVKKRGGFHWVLVDAPCSATGTWRRNPDARYRFHPNRLEEWVTLQKQLLTQAALAVRPGGYLVYGTCSWLVEENERLVEQFLAANPHFQCRGMYLFGNPDQDADTTFGAVLEKKAEDA